MKRLALFLVFFLAPLMLAAQIDLNSVGYKAFRLTINYLGRTINVASDALFYMENGRMLANIDYQYRAIKFLEKPAFIDIGTYNDNLFARCIDNEGYTCSFYIVFTPAFENKIGGKDVYTIAITYSNILFIYECYKTDERPWQEDPLDITNLVNQNNIYRTNPNYSDEEIEKFIKRLFSSN